MFDSFLHAPRARFAVVFFLAMTTAAGCQPQFEERASLVSELRVLGVRSEPAEGPPGTTIDYGALVGGPDGTLSDFPIQWAYCTLPKPVSELNDVNTACFFSNGDFLKPFKNTGLAVSDTIPLTPDNACNQFGPDIPDTKDKPPGRPADPDHTGGYYQPLRLLVDQGDHYDFVLGETRISCNLPGATVDVLLDYRKRYRPNQNPEIRSVVATTADGTSVALRSEDGGDSGFSASVGQKARLTLFWDPCPSEPACGNTFCEGGEDTMTCPEDCTDTPRGCPGAEDYVVFDLARRALVENREAMRVSWYATAGSFVDDRTGRTEADLETNTDNIWTAPRTPGPVTMWTVLRDSRGGIAWKAYRIRVE